jgi:hypothetical protein
MLAMRTGATASGLSALILIACGSSGRVLGGDGGGLPADASDRETLSAGTARCVAAGGECVQGATFCANVGPGATPQDCVDVSPLMICCAVNNDAGCTEIRASNYDQSCFKDSACIGVSVGNACYPCEVACGATIGAINVGAKAQYVADFDKTQAWQAPCSCQLSFQPPVCCRNGQCLADSACIPDASADAEDAGDSSAE